MKIINVNRRTYPRERSYIASALPSRFNATYASEDYVNINAVLVEGEVGDYAVYIGIGSPEWVSVHGNKLSYQEALCHFPYLEKKNYRE